MDPEAFLSTLNAVLTRQQQAFERSLLLILEKLPGPQPTPADAHDGTARQDDYPSAAVYSPPRLNVPDFHGRPNEDVTSWLFILGQNLSMANVPEHKKTLVAGAYLRESALQWYRRRLATNPKMTMAEFEAELKSMFLPSNHQELLRDKLDYTRQKGRLHDYVNEFMAILNQVEDMNEADKIHAFKRGLAPKTRAEVGYSAPKTLQAAIELAQGFDSNFFHGHNTHANAPPHSARPRYNLMDVDVNQAGTRAPKPRIVCEYCKRWGHQAHACRKKKGERKSNISETNKITRDEFIHVDALINGTRLVGLVDTGANQSLISPEAAKACGLCVESTTDTVTVADGTKVAPSGTARSVSVAYQGRSCQLTFTVMKLNHDALLGMDFLKAVNATIDIPGQRLLLRDQHQTNNSQVDDEVDPETSILRDNLWSLEEPDGELECKLTPDLDTSQQISLGKLLKRNEASFARSMTDLGLCTVSKYSIKTGTETPIFIHPYRKSLKERVAIQEEVKKMLDAGIIRESKSPWSFPVILVPKPDRTNRFCTDYRKLNAIMLHDPHPLPRMDDIFDRLSGSTWFSTLDLKSGYWQVGLDEDSMSKTAFSTPDGHYEYTRLPFGMKNAPAEFSRIMYRVLGHLPFVQIYLDDVTVHSTHFDEHLGHLQEVFAALRKANLKLNWEKCSFARKTIRLLGHYISGTGIAVDMSKTAAVQKMVPPKTLKELQRFLGLTGYYRKFILNYAALAAPLYRLLKKESTWSWGDAEQESFEELKLKLVEPPILRLPDMQRPFILQTDASGDALGAILSQQDGDGNEYVCQYESKLLKGAELNYGISEKECLAVVWAIRKFRPYLHGTHFTVVTDHSALKWLMTIKDLSGRLARWSVLLQEYNFDIIHRKGKSHSNVDALSRPPSGKANGDPTIEAMQSRTKIADPFDDSQLMATLKRNTEPNAVYEYSNGKIFYKPSDNKSNTKLEVPPFEERKQLIEQAHLLGHFQAKSTELRLREQYFWPNMSKDVQQVIDNCLPCLKHVRARVVEGESHSLPVTEVFDRVGIDCVFGLPTTNTGYTGILVLTEYLTKFPYAVPIKTKSAPEIAKHLLHFISLFGPPKVLLSDQGREFLNEIVDHLSKASGIERKVTSAYHPRTNGLTERFNQTLIQSLAKHAEADPLHWDDWLPYILLAYRTRIHSSTGFSPFELLYGRTANHFLSWRESTNDADKCALFRRSGELKELFEEKHVKARRAIEKEQTNQRAYRNKKNRPADRLQVGSKVFLSFPQKSGKLGPKYSGPYTIKDVTPKGNYWLLNDQKTTLKTAYPRSRIKPCNMDDKVQETYDVEDILDHRMRDGKTEYFVKWLGYPSNQNTWEPENHFDSLEPIEQYWTLKHGASVVDDEPLAAGTCE